MILPYNESLLLSFILILFVFIVFVLNNKVQDSRATYAHSLWVDGKLYHETNNITSAHIENSNKPTRHQPILLHDETQGLVLLNERN